MQEDRMDDLEWVSAMVDGQLDGDAFADGADALASSDDARSAWHSYHVIGDVLRSADLPDCAGDRAFVARLRARLQAESTVVPAVALVPAVAQPVAVATSLLPAAGPDARRADRASANDPVIRWKWLAAAASLAAVAVLGWNLTKPTTLAGAQLAGAEPAAANGQALASRPETAQPPVMLRDPRLDELLAAHRQYGGASALQTSAGFLRNATFEQPAR